jgi:hypothetical protein
MPTKRGESLDLPELLKEIKEDAKYIKYVEIVKLARKRLRIDPDRLEALSLLSNRTSRSLHASKSQLSPKSVSEAQANDMQARTRLTEIRVRVKIQADTLKDGMKAIKGHLLTQYADDFSKFANAEGRTALIERVQGTGATLLSESEGLIDMLDTIIKDIDQNSFYMSNLTEIMKLLDGSKGSRNV